MQEIDQINPSPKARNIFSFKLSIGGNRYQYAINIYELDRHTKKYDFMVIKKPKIEAAIGEEENVTTKSFFLVRHFRKFRIGLVKRVQLIERIK